MVERQTVSTALAAALGSVAIEDDEVGREATESSFDQGQACVWTTIWPQR